MGEAHGGVDVAGFDAAAHADALADLQLQRGVRFAQAIADYEADAAGRQMRPAIAGQSASPVTMTNI